MKNRKTEQEKDNQLRYPARRREKEEDQNCWQRSVHTCCGRHSKRKMSRREPLPEKYSDNSDKQRSNSGKTERGGGKGGNNKQNVSRKK